MKAIPLLLTLALASPVAAQKKAQRELPKVGTAAPGFSLPDLTNTAVSLRELNAEQPVVVVFGSFSCPVFRLKAPAFETLARRWQGKARFVYVFSREAHAGGSGSERIGDFADGLLAMDKNRDGAVDLSEFSGPRNLFDGLDLNADQRIVAHERLVAKHIDDFKDFSAPVTTEERVEIAKRFRRQVPGQIPVLIDPVENRTSKAYGGRPNSAFVVDPSGVIRLAQPWANGPQIDKALADITGEPETVPAPKPDWRAAEQTLAALGDQTALLIFTSPGCSACQQMKKTLDDPEIQAVVKKYVPIQLDVQDETAWALFQSLQLSGTPAFVMVSGKREILDQIEGYLDPTQFADFLLP